MIPLKLITLLGVCGAVSYALYWLGRQLMALHAQGSALANAAHTTLPLAQPLPSWPSWYAAVTDLSNLFFPFVEQLERADRWNLRARLDEWQRLLQRAGWATVLTPRHLLCLMFTASAGGGLCGSLLVWLLGSGLVGVLVVGVPLGLVGGFFFPLILLKRCAAERVTQIEQRLPFAIEFMLLALEANASLVTAMQEYCLAAGADPFAEELRLVLRELQHGTRLQEALTQLEWRIQSEILSAFLLAVVTGLETGQPMQIVLKLQADAARQQRFSAAEKIAKTASVRALFPLFVVMLSIFLLLLGPMLLKFMRNGIF